MTTSRHAKGTPEGGQFAASARAESDVNLTPTEKACFGCGHQHDPNSDGACWEATCQPGCSGCAERDGETLLRRFDCETHDAPGSCTPECTSLAAGMSGDEGVTEDPTGTTYGPPRPYDTYEYDEQDRASIRVTHVPEGQVLPETLTQGEWVYVDGEPRRVDKVTVGRWDVHVDFEGYDREPDGTPSAYFIRSFPRDKALDRAEAPARH